MKKKLKIKFELTKTGKENFEVYNGDVRVDLYEASRMLTNTTGEDSNGIFSNKDYICHGKYKEWFVFEDFDFKNTKSCEKNLKNRIATVKKWVKECKAKSNSHTFTIYI